jgi:hypothetical protein
MAERKVAVAAGLVQRVGQGGQTQRSIGLPVPCPDHPDVEDRDRLVISARGRVGGADRVVVALDRVANEILDLVGRVAGEIPERGREVAAVGERGLGQRPVGERDAERMGLGVGVEGPVAERIGWGQVALRSNRPLTRFDAIFNISLGDFIIKSLPFTLNRDAYIIAARLDHFTANHGARRP